MVYQVWPGNYSDGQALMQAIQNNCACQYQMGCRTYTCSAHEAFLTDPHWLKRMLFLKHLAARLIAEEHS